MQASGDQRREIEKLRLRKMFSNNPQLSSPGLTGRPSTPRPLGSSQTSLQNWVARSSRAMTVVGGGADRPIPAATKAGTKLAMTWRDLRRSQ